MVIRCGCGAEAKYLVYEHEEPHCEFCFREAIECDVPILVRKINELKIKQEKSMGG